MYASNLETHAAGYDARFASNVRAYTSDLEEQSFTVLAHFSRAYMKAMAPHQVLTRAASKLQQSVRDSGEQLSMLTPVS